MGNDGTQGSIKQFLFTGTAIMTTALTPLSISSYIPIPDKTYEMVLLHEDYSYPQLDNYFVLNGIENIYVHEPIIKLQTVKKLTVKIKKGAPLKPII